MSDVTQLEVSFNSTADELTLLWKQRMDRARMKLMFPSGLSPILPLPRWGLFSAFGSRSLSALSSQVVLWPPGQLLRSVLVWRLPWQPEQLWDRRNLQEGVCLHVTHCGGVKKWATLTGSIGSSYGQKGLRSWGGGHLCALKLFHCSFTLTSCFRAAMTTCRKDPNQSCVGPFGVLCLLYFLPSFSASLTTFTLTAQPYSLLWTWSWWDIWMQENMVDSAGANSLIPTQRKHLWPVWTNHTAYTSPISSVSWKYFCLTTAA